MHEIHGKKRRVTDGHRKRRSNTRERTLIAASPTLGMIITHIGWRYVRPRWRRSRWVSGDHRRRRRRTGRWLAWCWSRRVSHVVLWHVLLGVLVDIRIRGIRVLGVWTRTWWDTSWPRTWRARIRRIISASRSRRRRAGLVLPVVEILIIAVIVVGSWSRQQQGL